MTGRTASRRARDQAGLTLVEVLLTIAISGIISIPVLAWMVVGFKTERVVESSSELTRATNQINRLFARDISSAAQVTVGGADCAGVASGATVVVSILNHDLTQRVVYAGVVDGSAGRLVRRTCPPTGAVVEDETLFDDIALPLSTNLVATPSAAPSRPGDPSARIDLAATDVKGRTLRVTGSRRTGSDP